MPFHLTGTADKTPCRVRGRQRSTQCIWKIEAEDGERLVEAFADALGRTGMLVPAARNQCNSPLSAFRITSSTFIARSHAASGYDIEPSGSLSYPRRSQADRSLALRSGRIMYYLHD
jgi:hypothetical protein